MKILHLSKYYYPAEGGIETVCRDIVRILKRQEAISQRVFCFNTDKKNRVERVDGIPVIRAGCFFKLRSQSFSLSYCFLLKRLLKEFHPDVLHVHLPNPFAMFILLLCPGKYQLVLHWHSDIIEQKFLYWLIRGIEWLMLKRADKILVTTRSYLDGSRPLRPWKKKCLVFPNTVDMEKYLRKAEDENEIASIRAAFENRDIVFFIGRHVKYKGLEYLLKAERYVKSDCVFVIAGTGPLTKKLRRRFASDRIHFIGRIPDDQVRRYFYSSRILAFPSIARNEAFGMVLAEALCCGLPAVTFTIPGSGVNEVSIHNFTGLEVAEMNEQAFAAAIDQLLANQQMSERFRANAVSHISEKFSRRILESLLSDIYSEISRKPWSSHIAQI